MIGARACAPLVGAALAAGAVHVQAQDYTYVRMSLTVPWTLYFVFLACVLIPFAVMFVLAWRRSARETTEADSATRDETASRAP